MSHPTREELLIFCRDVKRTCERARCENWHPTTEDQRQIVRLADWAGNYIAEAEGRA